MYNSKKYLSVAKSLKDLTFSSSHFVNRMKVINGYLRKKAELNSFPTLAEIETTSLCNLRCTMCGRNFGEEAKKKQHMNWELFKTIIDQCSGHLELAILHAGGEPLMQPHIFDMIEYTKNAGIGAWMSSNATLLDETKAKQLIDSSLDGLVLSIDGISADTYEKIRVGGNFEQTKSNILRFLELKGKTNSKMFVTIQMIEMDINKHEVDQFKRFWSEFDVNVIIKPLFNWYADEQSLKYPNVLCDRPWYWIFIRSTGLVPPCGHDFEMTTMFGDLNRNSIAEVWNSNIAKNFRESIRHGKKGHPVCGKCDYAPARKRGLMGNIGQTTLDMLTICKILFLVGYKKIDRKSL